MSTTAATPRTRIAGLAVRARNLVDSGLCTRTSDVPDWLARLDQYEHLAAAPARERRAVLTVLDDDVVADLLVLAYLRHGSPYALWDDTPSGFVEDVLGIRTWGRLRTILDSVVDHPRVAAPVCFGAGARTQIAPLLGLWHVAVRRDNDALCMILCPTGEASKIVRDALPRLADAAGLPRMPAVFTGATGTGPDDEFALGGLHTRHLLLIATDAGNFHPVQGAAIDLISSFPVRVFAVGTPAREPGTWFADFAARATTRTVNMAIDDLPSVTGEDIGPCHTCPPGTPVHSKAAHLPDQNWAGRQIALRGPASPYVSTGVHARFTGESGPWMAPAGAPSSAAGR